MRFNLRLFLPGIAFLLLILAAAFAERTGYIGVFAPDNSVHGYQGSWKPPLYSFRASGCCTDDMRRAFWRDNQMDIITDETTIRVRLEQAAQGQFWLPGGQDVLGFVTACGRVWVPETRHERLLEVFSDGSQKTIVGSNAAGSINAVAALGGSPIQLVMTASARSSNDEFVLQTMPLGTQKLYVSRSAPSAPSILLWKDGSGVSTLQIGEDLTAPSGIAVSSDGNTLYVEDERADELAWLRIVRNGDNWESQGKMARFPLGDAPRGLIRGITVFRYNGTDVIAGSSPSGVEFYLPDGRHLGTITMPEPTSRLFLTQGKETLLYVVAGRSLWQAQLRNAQPEPALTCTAVQQGS